MAKWTDTGNDFEQAPTGTHLARCIRIIDLGTQHGEWQGKPTAKRQTIITWELPMELNADEKPYIISKFYTTSLGEKANLRKDLVSWRGREFTPQELEGFDPRNVLGKPCQVTIIQKESGKHAVSAVTSVPKGISVPTAQNPLVFFDIDESPAEDFDKLSDGIKRKIEESDEWKAKYAPVPKSAAASALATTFGGSVVDSSDDDIPF